MSGLSPKQERFCLEYIKDLNATSAYLRAGYSKKGAGQSAHTLLKNPEIAKRIADLKDAQFQALHMSAAEVLALVARDARSSMGAYLHVTAQGDPYIDLSKATEDDLACLTEATIEDFTEGRGEDARDVRRVKVKKVDSLRAKELLMKHMGLLRERVEMSFDEDFGLLLEGARKRAAST